jgi:hypothetical protein
MKTLEEMAEEFLIRQGCQRMCCNDPECNGVGDFFEDVQPKDLIEFAKWQAEKMYSEEEVLEILLKHQSDYRSAVRNTSPLNWSFDINKWFEKSKKEIR